MVGTPASTIEALIISLFAAMVVARVCKLQSQLDGVVRVEKKSIDLLGASSRGPSGRIISHNL